MHAADILEITMMSSCLGLVFYPMHARTLLSIHKIISYSLLDGTGLYTRPSYRQYSMNPDRQGSQGSAVSLLWALGSQFSFHHALTHFQSFLHSQYLSHDLSLYPLSLPPCIRPSSFPLPLMLMHSQSGCPLSRRALHVHQAVQRPACK